MDTIIDAKELCFQSGERYLLNHITWQVKSGEHWLIFGLNGCGKTTLLTTIAGFKNASSGQLTVFGQTFTNKNILQLRKKIGLVSSSFFDNYYTKESCLSIVLSGLAGRLGLNETVDDADILFAKQLFIKLQIEDKMYLPFSILSKGERQNVLIARALISKPELLLLDEPGTGLDVYAREKMLNMIAALVREINTTVIYVTHYPEEIQPDLFQKCLLLKNGRVFAAGDLYKVFTSENLSRLIETPVQLIQHGETIHLKFDAAETAKKFDWRG